MPCRLPLLALLCAAVPAFGQGGAADLGELPESAQRRFCGLLFDTLIDATVVELQGTPGAAPGGDALRKRAFVVAELRLANESLLYGSGSDRDLRLAQGLMERVAALPSGEERPYVAQCVAGAVTQADALRRDVGAAARNVVVEHFLAQRLPAPPNAAAAPVVLPPLPASGGTDAWFPSEAARPASAPTVER